MLVAGIIIGSLVLITLVVFAIVYYKRIKIIDEDNVEYLNKKKKYYLFVCLTMIISFIVYLTLALIFELYFNWTQTALCMVPSMVISFVLAVRTYAQTITIRHKMIHLNNKHIEY